MEVAEKGKLHSAAKAVESKISDAAQRLSQFSEQHFVGCFSHNQKFPKEERATAFCYPQRIKSSKKQRLQL